MSKIVDETNLIYKGLETPTIPLTTPTNKPFEEDIDALRSYSFPLIKVHIQDE